MKRLKEEKGAITLITLITVLFLVSFLMTSYILISNKVKTQKEILSETRKLYEPKTTMEEIYNSYFINDNIIPIYTVEQLLAIGNDKTVTIDGKVYTFSNTEETAYLLKNDLEFNANDLNLESDWIAPYENIDLLANFDWSGHTIKVTKLNGETITYDGTYLAKITGNPLTLKNSVKGNLLDYKIYGNSVQNGTPTPETPVEIESVGDKTNNIADLSKVVASSSTKHVTFDYDNSTGTLELTSTPTKYDYTSITAADLGLEEGKTYYYGADITVTGKADSNLTRVRFGLNVSASTPTYYFTEDGTMHVQGEFTYTGQSGVNLRMFFNYGSDAAATGRFDNIYVNEVGHGFESYGKYKIPIKVSNGTKETITNIYLDEPLRKAGDYADYIDFEKQVVVRKVKYREFTSDDNWSQYVSVANHFQVTVSDNLFANEINPILSNYYSNKKNGINYHSSENYAVLSVDGSRIRFKNKDCSTVEEWKAHLNSLSDSVQVIYALAKDNPEPIELPDISILKGTNKIEVNTQIQPSSISVTYNAKQ